VLYFRIYPVVKSYFKLHCPVRLLRTFAVSIVARFDTEMLLNLIAVSNGHQVFQLLNHLALSRRSVL
jgi:hypothetical protein